VEHYKIADYSFIDIEHEISEADVPIAETEKVEQEIEAQLLTYFSEARKVFKKMYGKGGFDLT
jgi:hypothetical protein